MSFPLQASDEVLKNNHHQVSLIEKMLPDLKKRETEIMGQSTEGGKVVGYYLKDDLKKISATLFGEIGRVEQGFYFDKGKLIFIHENSYRYDRPFGKVVDSQVNQYSFHQGQMLSGIENGKPLSKSQKDFESKQNKFQSLAKEYQQHLKDAVK